MEMEEVVKVLIVVFFIAVMIGAVIFLLKFKGGALLDKMFHSIRLGR